MTSGTPATSEKPAHASGRWWPDACLTALLFSAALGVRLPYLTLLPPYVDEGIEVLYGIVTLADGRVHLTHYDAYDGPLFPYLIYAVGRAAGPSLVAPRLLVAIAGAMTVAAIYWLGRAVWNRTAGLAGAGLAATNPLLVLDSSHYAYSASLAPLLITLAVLVMQVGTDRMRLRSIGLAGVLTGMAIQAHPTTGACMIGLLLWLATRRGDEPAWGGRALRAAGIGFVIGYLPMIVANISTPLVSLRVATGHSYAFELASTDYLSRVLAMARELLQAMGGRYGGSGPPVGTLSVALAAGMGAWGVVASWRRNRRALAYALMPSVIVMPLLLREFFPRYIAFLLPLAFVATGIGLDAAKNRIAAHAGRRWQLGSWPGTVVLVALVMFLVGGSSAATWAFVERALGAGWTNAEYFRLLETLQSRQMCGERLAIVDERSPVRWGQAVRAVTAVLALGGCEHRVIPSRLAAANTIESSGWLWILSTPDQEPRDPRLVSRHIARATFPQMVPAEPSEVVLSRIEKVPTAP